MSIESNDTGVATLPNPETESAAPSLAGKYLTFHLAKEQFGFQILKVREIISVVKITPIPNVASYIRGVINLRGKIIPVMDLREKLHLTSVETDRRNCIIITEFEDEGDMHEMGLLVDSVSEVLDIEADDIKPAPRMGQEVQTKYIQGMAQSGQNVKILLDIDRVIADCSSLKVEAEQQEDN